MTHGAMRAGSPVSGTTPRAFVDQMVADNAWARSVPTDVRRAIASAIDRQCSPWFIDYEHWRAHVADFCWRSSRAHMRATERYDSHLADLLAAVNEAGRQCAELTSRVAVLERQLDEALHPQEDRDSALLPTTERIDRAQRRAARSRSPGPRDAADAAHAAATPDGMLLPAGWAGYGSAIGANPLPTSPHTPRAPATVLEAQKSLATTQRVLDLL